MLNLSEEKMTCISLLKMKRNSPEEKSLQRRRREKREEAFLRLFM